MATPGSATARKTVLGRLLLLVVTTSLVLGSTECGMRLALPASALLDPDSDAFWIVRLRRVAPAERRYADETVYDEVLGWRGKPGFARGDVHQDSRGLRGTREHELAAHDGTRRIVVLGDSFTWGLGVADDETYAARLEALLPATEVINLGVSGYGTDQQVLAWEHHGVPLRPDVVVLGFFIHDFVRNGRSVYQYPKPHFVADAGEPGGFRLAGVPVASLDDVDDDRRFPVASTWRLADAMRLVARKVERRMGWFDPELGYAHEVAVLDYLIARLAASTRSHGAKLLVVLIPAREGAEFRDAAFIERKLVETCAAHGVALHSLSAELAGSEDRLYAGAHWNAEGHAAAAASLAESIGALP